MVSWHSHATAARRDRSISIWPRRSDLIAPDARRLRIRRVTVVRRTPSICDSASWVSGRTSWSMWSLKLSSQRAMRTWTGCSALQAAPSWNCVSIALRWAWSACRSTGLRLKAARNREAGIREAVPAAWTMAVMAEGDGPSAERMPTAPSHPIAAVATVCPFAMSIISEMAPL
jgi:hypothetical protein